MAKRQNPFGGGPRIGGDAPGEPANSPIAEGVSAYGGAPSMGTGVENRGVKAVNPDPSSEIFPAPYGGGNPFVNRPNVKPAKGSGANNGAGTITPPSE